MEQQYRMSDRASAVRSILDLGANVGLATIYYLNRFPEARASSARRGLAALHQAGVVAGGTNANGPQRWQNRRTGGEVTVQA